MPAQACFARVTLAGVMSELPGVEGFEAASQFVRPEHFKSSAGFGPDPDNHLSAIRKFTDAGFEHIVLLGVGPRQDEFIEFFERSLKPQLGELARTEYGDSRRR